MYLFWHVVMNEHQHIIFLSKSSVFSYTTAARAQRLMSCFDSVARVCITQRGVERTSNRLRFHPGTSRETCQTRCEHMFYLLCLFLKQMLYWKFLKHFKVNMSILKIRERCHERDSLKLLTFEFIYNLWPALRILFIYVGHVNARYL